jgi:hypothetical protein
MTITSYGYPGSVDKIGHAVINRNAGAEYNVHDFNAGRVTAINSGADRSVTVGAGLISGRGVTDINSAPVTVGPLPTVSSGERYDMIVANRNFTTKVTTFTYITGSASRALPARLNSVTDGVDQQPLALVRLVAGQQYPSEVIDLRVTVGEGGAHAFANEPSLIFATSFARPGTMIRFPNGQRWQLGSTTAGSLLWTPERSAGAPISLFSASNPLAGPVVPAGTLALVQGGSFVLSTDLSGYARITFPTPFPNGLITYGLLNGDDNAGNALIFGGSGNPAHGASAYGSRFDLVYHLWGPSGGGNNFVPLAGFNHRVNWFALGW